MHAKFASAALLLIGLCLASGAIADACPVPGGPFVNGEQFPAGGNTNAYYWIDVVACDRIATVRFVGNGPSNLPDPLFIARVGETNRVVLLVGKTYDVRSAARVQFLGASSNAVDVQIRHPKAVHVPDYRFTVCHPVEITFVPRSKGKKRRPVKATILNPPESAKRAETASERRSRLLMQREAVKAEAARRLANRPKLIGKRGSGQLRRQADKPQRWFLESDARWDGEAKDEQGALYRIPVVNTNAALYGFLGCEFGSRGSHSGETYVKQKPHFRGFPWVRKDTSPRSDIYARCDARMTFRAEGRSTIPARRMKAMRDLFARRYGVEFLVESEGADWFVAEGLADDEYHVGVYATNYVDNASSSSAIIYEIGFEVVNELCIRGSDNDYFDEDADIWHKALHVTDIASCDLERGSAWKYTVTRGKSTEEMLDEMIRTGDDTPLKIPGQRYMIGTPVQGGYFCNEWEADGIFCTYEVGGFFHRASPEEHQRISAKLYYPSFFRPRKPGERRHYRDGAYIGEILPGDTITWQDDDYNLREGTVCDADGEGEFVEKFGCRIRTTKTTEMARPCDYLPTQVSSNYIAAAESVRKLRSEYQAEMRRRFPDNESIATNTTGFCTLAGMYLAKLHEQVRPGKHVSCTYGIFLDRTRQVVRETVRRRERNDFAKWQRAIEDAIYDIINGHLRRIFLKKRSDDAKGTWNDGTIALTDDLCSMMGLTAYERKFVENNRRERHAVSETGPVTPFPRLGEHITAPYLPAFGQPPEDYPYRSFIVSGESDIPRVVNAIEAMKQTNELDVAFAVWTAAETIIPLETDREEKERAIVSLAIALAKRGAPNACAWTAWRLLFEHGDSSMLPWTFLRETAAFGRRNGFTDAIICQVEEVDNEGRVTYVERNETKSLLKWAAEMLSSKDLQKMLDRESEADAKAWRERLDAAGLGQ